MEYSCVVYNHKRDLRSVVWSFFDNWGEFNSWYGKNKKEVEIIERGLSIPEAKDLCSKSRAA